MSSKKNETDSNGIPVKSTATPEGVPVLVLASVFNLGVSTIGGAIAYYGLYGRSKAAADAKIAVLAENDLGWLYAVGVLAFKLGNFLIGLNLAMARKESKVNVPDQQVYQVKGAAGSKLGYVLMEYDGALGRFNRAQRGLQNYNEHLPVFLMYYLLGGYVLPFEASMIACFYVTMRCVSAVGYTKGADGRVGGVLAAFVGMSTLEALVVISGVKALQQ